LDWHARYTQQAQWTAQTRHYLFERARIKSAARVLEVGCGTGAILKEIPEPGEAQIHGIDLSFSTLTQTRSNAPKSLLACCDGQSLPYPDRTFDVTFCHYFLLWVNDPVRALSEMRRVTRTNGVILALAEPDYGGRIDYPPALEPLGRWQAEALRQQGADVDTGRKLRRLFVQAGIKPIEMGIIAGGWSDANSSGERELEWQVLENDLSQTVDSLKIKKMKQLDELAWKEGERVLFVPTFYAWGVIN
jgi:ubiquinone/menaquinone biosynthesis C-methylase UbiE